MRYSELIQTYFERSVALQWYWTVYILVIGGVLAFSAFRRQPEWVTTVLVALLYVGFAYKNLGAIETTAEERQAILQVIKDYPTSGENSEGRQHGGLRDRLEPKLPDYDIAGARYFHLVCDLLVLIFLGVKEWHRRHSEAVSTAAGQ
jgi:hypothetical protein